MSSNSVTSNCPPIYVGSSLGNKVSADRLPTLFDSVQGISQLLAESGKTAQCSSGFRESAHQQGQCHSALNGSQPIFALLGYEDIRSLEGRLLTIVDASFTDREQRKAVKDLVRNALWFDWVPNLDMDGSGGKPDLNR